MSEEIVDRALNDGTVLLLVGLKVPWRMENILSEDAILAQRRARCEAICWPSSQVQNTRLSVAARQDLDRVSPQAQLKFPTTVAQYF
ncbi:MAG: hypothetical protein ACREO5_09470 [Candidatus Binatia bacterium]